MKPTSEIKYWIGLCLIIIPGLFACQPQKGKTEVNDLRCEYLTHPLGIDVRSPRLSWKMVDENRGAAQTAYRILAATNNELLQAETPDLWDSGKTESNRSVQIEYKGKPLQSGMKVFWKVQIWNEKGAASNWSETAKWEMALLNETDWQAKWIGAPELLKIPESKLPAPIFRKEITVEKNIKNARVYISGLGYYEFYINGEKIGDHVLSPNQTNYDRREVEKWSESRIGNMNTTVLYETFDITNSLKQGENALGVILGNGWYIQADRPDDKMLWYDTPRFIAQVELELEDGNKQIITSDETWKSSLSPILYNGLHSGEIYNASLEQNGWNTTGFDESNWKNAEIVRPPTGILKAQISPPDRVTKTLKPVSVTEVEKGIYRFDLGEMISGWVRLKISGEIGTKIKLRYIEELGPTYGQTDTYFLKGKGTEIWEPRFTWHAFRFVDVSGSSAVLTLENLEGRVVNTDVQTAGNFESSDTLLNRILTNYRSTQLGNLHGGIPSDCPHRERRGYTGDGQVSAKAAMYNFDMAAFYTKWLNDISDAQNHKTGYVPNTTPYQDGGGGTAWGAAYIIIPWYMYRFYDDSRILEQHYAGMKHWIEYMKNSLDEYGILTNQGLGEWVPPEAVQIPPDFVNACYYYHCCRLMEKISDVLKNTNDKEYFGELAAAARENINSTWLNVENSNYSIGKQGANILPLGFGIVDKNKSNAVFENLFRNVMDNDIHFDTGILATPLLLEVLTEAGRADLAYTLMIQRDFPSFGYMIEKGATTIWETWPGDASHSHPMFGSVCQWFYQHLGGISPDDENPGFKHTIIKPWPVRLLDFVNTSYPSQYGTIILNWKFENDDYLLNVIVPANTSATVYVLAENIKKVTESKQAVSEVPSVKFIKMDEQNAVFEVKSGTYRFVSKGAKALLRKPVLPAPVIYPENELGMVNDSVKIIISSGIKNSEIHYTVNGDEPDKDSEIYSTPFFAHNSMVIKAKTFVPDYKPSYTKTSSVNFINPEKNGLTYSLYEGVWTSLPDFSKLSVANTGTVYEFGLDKINQKKDEFALKLEGTIEIEKGGEYTFYVNSNDGSCLYINNKLVVNHNGLHGADLEKSAKIELEKGMYPIQLDYFQAGGGMYLRVQYCGPEIIKQDVPAQVLFQK